MNCIDFNPLHRDFFEKQKYCDVFFIAKNSKGQIERTGAHKLILAIVSDVFEVMFFGEAAQRGLHKEEKEIEISDIEMETFKLFLSFIYGFPVTFNNSKDVADFYYAAHKYNCMEALKITKDYIKNNINTKNATIYYEFALLYGFEDLQRACEEIFEANTKEVLESSDFFAASSQTVNGIFQQKDPNVDSELDFVQALERYIEHHKDSDPEIAEKVRPALNNIRFLTLSPRDIAKTSLLTDREIREIIIYQGSQDDSSEVSSGFSKIRNSRDSKMKMIKKLESVYSQNKCSHCRKFGDWSNHSLMSCNNLNQYYGNSTNQNLMTKIYQKYNHYKLWEYFYEDVKTIYNIYEKYGFI